MNFMDWLEAQGCEVDLVQDEDNNGYVVIEVKLPFDPEKGVQDIKYKMTVDV